MKTAISFLLLTFVLLGVLTGISGCGCPDLISESSVEPRIREATITRFEPAFDKAQNLPSPQYSIHTFTFPANINSSGSLPNDFRVSNGREIILDSKEFTDPPDKYTAALITQFPTNDTLTGDIMVISVDRVNRRACVRFAGDLASISKGFASGSAADFAIYLKSLLNPPPGRAPVWEAAATPFGSASPGVLQCNAAFQPVVKVFDSKWNDVTALHPAPPAVAAELLSKNIAKSFEALVAVGDIYYYRARNGIEYAVLIEDIFEGSLLPNLQRMTIKFTEIKGPSCNK